MQAVKEISQEASTQPAETRFNRSAVVWTITVLNVLSALNSSFFFLGQLNTGITGWLMMNSCVPSIAIFAAGFLFGSPTLLVAGTVWLVRYGTAGLFVFPWDGFNLIAQVGHLLMTTAAVYVLVDVIRNKRWRALSLGAVIGVGLLVPFMFVQGAWLASHPELMEALFSGTLAP
jgi:hypothetical protein